jgi:hypothetical protein
MELNVLRFVSAVCLVVRVAMVDKNKAVFWSLVVTSAITLTKKKKTNLKMWSKKWYLKRNTSCDAHLLNEFLETDVEEMLPPWCRQVN